VAQAINTSIAFLAPSANAKNSFFGVYLVSLRSQLNTMADRIEINPA
jgi:hypothetical protein